MLKAVVNKQQVIVNKQHEENGVVWSLCLNFIAMACVHSRTNINNESSGVWRHTPGPSFGG